MKSVEDKILDFFRERPDQVWDSGDIQRMSFTNKNGTLAKPKSISRRLQELAENGKLHQVGDMKSAKYSLNKVNVAPKIKYRIEVGADNIARQIPCA